MNKPRYRDHTQDGYVYLGQYDDIKGQWDLWAHQEDQTIWCSAGVNELYEYAVGHGSSVVKGSACCEARLRAVMMGLADESILARSTLKW